MITKEITFAQYEAANAEATALFGEQRDWSDPILARLIGDFAVYGYGLRYCHKTECATGYIVEYETYDYCD